MISYINESHLVDFCDVLVVGSIIILLIECWALTHCNKKQKKKKKGAIQVVNTEFSNFSTII